MNSEALHLTAAPATVEVAFQQAVDFHERGLLAQAEMLYREILRREPTHSEALHLLGLVALSKSDVQSAIQLIGAALALNPAHAVARVNLGGAFLQQQRPADALACYDDALRLAPRFAGAHYNRGNALAELGRLEEAVDSYDHALELEPNHLEAHNNRGDALMGLQRPQEALVSFEYAIQLDSRFAPAHNNRGNALLALERPTEALAAFDRAVELRPDYAEGHYNRGNALADLHRAAEALTGFERALQLRPNYPGALLNRAIALLALDRAEEGLASCDRAIELEPGHAAALTARGTVLLRLLRPTEALMSFQRALELRPNSRDVLNNYGSTLVMLQKHEEAVACFSRLLEVSPEHDYAAGALFHSQLHCCEWTDYRPAPGSCNKDVRRIVDAVLLGKRVSTPFCLLAVTDSAATQRQCSQLHAVDRYSPASRPLWQGDRYQHERVRVAYLSADFHNHVTAHLAAQLFERHDRDRFEITAISFGPEDGSAMRARLRRAFDRFVDVRSMSDAAVAQLLRELEIDIAVDLKGFTENCRTGILAHRAAPIQVSYLGYPGTLGAPYIDYIVADREVIPPADQQHYAEQVVYLPECYQVNDSTRAIAARTPERAEVGLPATGFVFCCFNSSYKITPVMFDIWMRLLRQVPGSVLWLLQGNSTATQNLRREAELRGVDPQRLVFAAWMAAEEHLARQRLADLFLDTLPVNAHTTASDALWAGLPVLTCRGQAFAGRVAASLLTALDLRELITGSLQEYEQRALGLATNPERLATVRAKLATNSVTHALFDTARFCRHLEAAYLNMWQRYQSGKRAAGFTVEPLDHATSQAP
jgi:predicted O-linked N-acetylglucosamine transferase (SPINDLY family)